MFILLRDKLNNILRFVANPSVDCELPGECYHTGFVDQIKAIISDKGHSQMALLVSFGKGHDGVDGWYPKGFHRFENRSAEMFFETVPLLKYEKTVNSVIGGFPRENISPALLLIHLLSEYPYCQHSIRSPSCINGFRCPLGECLDRRSICNGVQECHDGSDESHENCDKKYRACPADHLVCRNGRCVPQVAFCDGVDQCGDGTDEPTSCSCFTFLK